MFNKETINRYKEIKPDESLRRRVLEQSVTHKRQNYTYKVSFLALCCLLLFFVVSNNAKPELVMDHQVVNEQSRMIVEYNASPTREVNEDEEQFYQIPLKIVNGKELYLEVNSGRLLLPSGIEYLSNEPLHSNVELFWVIEDMTNHQYILTMKDRFFQSSYIMIYDKENLSWTIQKMK